jgi:hypothetical protein
MKPQTTIDTAILQAALIGFRHQTLTIAAHITKVEDMLKAAGAIPATEPTTATIRKAPHAPKTAPAAPKRRMSAAGRAAVRAAQKKRWAAFHAGKAPSPTAKLPKPKRVLSKAQLVAMRQNATKARKARKARVLEMRRAS